MFGRIQFARYISAPIALRYGISGPSNSSSFSQGQNGSFFASNDWTTIGKLKGCAFIHIKMLQNFLNVC